MLRLGLHRSLGRDLYRSPSLELWESASLWARGSPLRDGDKQVGVAWADYDNDGFLDLLITRERQGAQNLLYRNNGNGNGWLKVKLIGTVSNRSAIGAKLRVQATIRGQAIWQMREITGNSGQDGGFGGLLAHFGLGDATEVEVLRIEWPSGIVQELTGLDANQLLTVTEPPRLLPLAPRGFQIQCWLNQSFDVEASTDLATWTHLTTLTREGGALEFHDQDNRDHACRYYRVMSR